MKLLLFLEHRFFINKKKEVFCERVVDYEFLKRYLNVFDEVYICARTEKVNEDFKTNLRVDGPRIFLVELPDFKGNFGIIRKYLECKRIIEDSIKKYDVALLRGPSPISLLALNLVVKSKIPFAVEFMVNPETTFNKEVYKGKFSYLIRKIFVNHAKKLCMSANGVSYVTEKILQSKYPCQAMLKGESEEYFTSYYSTINLKDKDFYNRDSVNNTDKFVIIHVGFMDKYSKGHREVIEVAKRLLDKGYNIEVKFIGTGNLENNLKKMCKNLGIEKNIIFKGQIDRIEEIQKEHKKSNLFLFPTKSEGLPRALIEAMANSLPCVSTPVDGIPELLSKEYLVDYKNIDTIVNIVENFILDKNLCLKEGKRNYKKALEYKDNELEKRRTEFYKKLKNFVLIKK